MHTHAAPCKPMHADMAPMWDLQHIAHELGHPFQHTLSHLIRSLLGVSEGKDKEVTCSDWEAKELTKV